MCNLKGLVNSLKLKQEKLKFKDYTSIHENSHTHTQDTEQRAEYSENL